MAIKMAIVAMNAIDVERSSCLDVGRFVERRLGCVVHKIFSVCESEKITSELIADKNETGTYHSYVCGVRMAPITSCSAPIAHRNQNGAKRKQLSDFNA